MRVLTPIPPTAAKPLTVVDHPLANRPPEPWSSAPAALVAVSAQSAGPPAPATRVWPAAFQTRDESKPYETMGVVYFEKTPDPAKAPAEAPPVLSARPVPAPGAAFPGPSAAVAAQSDHGLPLVGTVSGGDEPTQPTAATAIPTDHRTVSAVKPTQPTAAPVVPTDLRTVSAVKPTQPTAATAVPTDLRQRVQAACGQEAIEVTVVNQPDKSVMVKVRVPDAAAETKVTEKLLQLPEMAQPMVHLQMDVRP